MADLTITPADVARYSGARSVHGIAGETIAAGQTLFLHTDRKVYKADASTAAKAAAVGVALNGASADQPVTYLAGGGLDPGAAVAVGTVYGVTDTAGGIGAVSERAAEDFITILGVAVTTSRINVAILRSGVAIPAG